MNETKLTVKFTTAFKKDYKLAKKRGLNMERLQAVIGKLAMGEPLPRNTGIMSCPTIGKAIGNAISSRIGYSFIASKTTCWS